MAARAETVTGLYVGAGAGLNILQGTDVSVTGPLAGTLTPAQRRGSVDFDYGFAAVSAIGYGYGNGLRLEVEFNARSNEVDSASGFSSVGTNRPRSGGDVISLGLMLNGYYDFDMGPGSMFTPYVGAGVGYVWSYVNSNRARNVATGSFIDVTGNEEAPAFQLMAGVAMPISMVPGLSMTAEYRYMQVIGAEAEVRSNQTFLRGKTDFDNVNHSVMLGLRYAFGAAPAPAPVVAPTPAAAPAVARTYLVFFDFDRADLTDRARQIIGEAATNSRGAGTTRIEVSGHADRSGTPQYNQRLSERRAAAVAAELERRGVARSAMTIQAFGESRPLVPTADGVREPQNRRVEIVLR